MKKGFTLLELLIVIGILAILATTVVLVLNPAELLRQARDSQRVSDLGTLTSALSLYVTAVGTPDLHSGGTGCHGDGGTVACFIDASSGMALDCDALRTGSGTVTTTASMVRTVLGSGWLPVNFGAIPGGAPLAALPTDPATSTTRFYSYTCNTTDLTFELNAVFESAKYLTTDDFDAKDGGNVAGVYEVGTDPALDL